MPKKHNSLTVEKKHDSKKGGGGYPSGGGDYPSGGGDYPSGGGDYPSGGGDYPSGGGGQGQGCMALKSKKKCLKVKLLQGGMFKGGGRRGVYAWTLEDIVFRVGGWGVNSPVLAIPGMVVVRVRAAWFEGLTWGDREEGMGHLHVFELGTEEAV
jgi:hypothetical protein